MPILKAFLITHKPARKPEDGWQVEAFRPERVSRQNLLKLKKVSVVGESNPRPRDYKAQKIPILPSVEDCHCHRVFRCCSQNRLQSSYFRRSLRSNYRIAISNFSARLCGQPGVRPMATGALFSLFRCFFRSPQHERV